MNRTDFVVGENIERGLEGSVVVVAMCRVVVGTISSHLYGKLGHRACGVLGVAPIRGSGGWRSPSGYPDGFHNGAFCKFASTSVKVLVYGYACENDSHTAGQ